MKGKSTGAEWMDLTQVQWLGKKGSPPQQSMLICQLVHQSVEVWWPQDKKFYKGTVTEYLAEKVGPGPNVNRANPLVCPTSQPVHVSLDMEHLV